MARRPSRYRRIRRKKRTMFPLALPSLNRVDPGYRRLGYNSWRPNPSGNVAPVLAARGIGVPQRIMFKLRYCDTIQHAGIGLASQVTTFRANSLYDTQSSGATGGRNAQPSYFDQLIQLWDAYLVHGVKYRITFVNEGTTPVDVAVSFDSDSSPVASHANFACEQFKASAKLCSDQRPVVLKGYMDPFKLLGIYKQGQWGAAMFGTIATNPGNPVYMHIFTSNPLETTQTFNVYINVELVFYTEFKKRNSITDA